MRFSVDNRNHTSRNGFTLIEIVIGLTLLAALLVGVLQAHGTHHRQLRLSADRIIATDIADELLERWHRTPEGVPVLGRGVVPERPGWMWRTEIIAARTLATLPVHVIRLQIIDQSDRKTEPKLLCSVETVKPIDTPPSRRVP